MNKKIPSFKVDESNRESLDQLESALQIELRRINAIDMEEKSGMFNDLEDSTGVSQAINKTFAAGITKSKTNMVMIL